MKAINCLWISLVFMGMFVAHIIPLTTLLGFNIAVFISALAYNYIGLKGLMVFYVVWVPKNFAFNYASSVALFEVEKGLFSEMPNLMRGVDLVSFWKPTVDTVTHIDKLISTLHTIQPFFTSPLMIVAFMSVEIIGPLFWFISCRRIIKKLGIYKRLGLLRN